MSQRVAMRLANQTPGEWRLWIDRRAEQLGVPRATLQEIVEDLLRDKEKEARKTQAEERRQEARVEKQRHEEEHKENASSVASKKTPNLIAARRRRSAPQRFIQILIA